MRCSCADWLTRVCKPLRAERFERLGRLAGAAGARRAERVGELLVLVGRKQQLAGMPDQSADLDIGLGASGRFAPVDEYRPRLAGRIVGSDGAPVERK